MGLILDAVGESLAATSDLLDGLFSDRTIIMWVKVDSTGSNTVRMLCSKKYTIGGIDGDFTVIGCVKATTPNQIFYIQRRATTNAELQTNSLTINGVWLWLCVVDAQGLTPKCYYGYPNVRPVEATYVSTPTAGVGDTGTEDEGTPVEIGRKYNATQSAQANFDFFAVYPWAMTEGEALSHWSKPRSTQSSGGTRPVLWTWPAYHGAASAVDWSGNNISMSINGSPTVGPRAPIPFGVLQTAE